MKPITLNIAAWPYIGQPLIRQWKEKSEWISIKGYLLLSIKPSTDYTGITCWIMNPKGKMFWTTFYFLCKYYTWEDKDKEIKCHPAK